MKRPAEKPADDSERAEEPMDPTGGSSTVSYSSDIPEEVNDNEMAEVGALDHACERCKGRFETRNKLHKHLKRMKHYEDSRSLMTHSTGSTASAESDRE